MHTANHICSYPIFAGLSQAELDQLAACLTKRAYGKGAYLYHPGNPAVNFYLIESGLVRLFFTDARGQEYLLELVGPGAMVGVPLLYEDQVRALGAAAVAPSMVLAFPQSELLHFAQRFPRLMHNIYRSLDVGMRRLEDLRYWVEADRKLALRAFDLIEAILRDPFTGIGKPEPLKYLAPGTWSRRLTQEHRIVYLVRDERIDFLQARYHYS